MKKFVYICAAICSSALLASCSFAGNPAVTTNPPALSVETTAPVTVETVSATEPVANTAVTTTETTTAATTEETTTAATMALPDALSVKELQKREKEAKQNGTLTVIIDPGHGIADPGALHDENLGSVTEASLTLTIANELKTVLEDRGYTVIMTHDGVTKPWTEWDDGKAVFGPSERCSFSNEQDAHLFMSLHCDAYPESPNVYGTRIYYPVSTPFSTKLDKQYAKALAGAIEQSFPNDKEVSLMDMHGKDCYTVLYKTLVPSVLVECGFITNKSDAEKLLNEEWRAKFAAALADGIDNYFE
ncbi:MAG: N-acetylmuramoyl-L-alanine amidase [Clostridia bacterium]|nr:N-acetylmuramoyl-L-alanine amidase [Clostridia bacterium]